MNIEEIVNKQATKLRIKHQFNELTELECKTFLNEFLEAINFITCCTTLKAGDTPTFKQWLKLKKIPKIDNLYYYKGTHYFLIEIKNIYKEWCGVHL